MKEKRTLKKKPFLYYIGNFLIVISLLGLAYIFWPIAQLYLAPPPPIQKPTDRSFQILIPKIHAQAKVIEQVNSWNEHEYKEALRVGVAHAKYSSLPGGIGTIYLFAHSSMYPWEMTRSNTAFFRLGELKIGDTIVLYRGGKQYNYAVSSKKTVWPTELSYLLEGNKTQLILQTCTPIGTDLQRLLVFAELKVRQ